MGKVCAFSGHRILREDFNEEILRESIEKLVEEGFDTFLTGMAVGFDTVAAEIVIEMKREHDLKLIAYIPCPEQSKNFSDEEKARYENILENVEKKVIVSKNYTKGCMQKRNRKLVDDCELLLCYLSQATGGTRYTFNYALSSGTHVQNVVA